MPRGMVAGSIGSRILALLAKRPATGAGLGHALQVRQSTISSTMGWPLSSGRVRRYYSLEEARQRGVNFLEGPGRQWRSASVFGLAQPTLLEKSQDRGRRGMHQGTVEAVRTLLAREDGLRAEEVAERLKKPLLAVRHALHYLTKFGGAVATGDGRPGSRYYLYSRSAKLFGAPPPDAERPYKVAAPITIGRGSNWAAAW